MKHKIVYGISTIWITLCLKINILFITIIFTNYCFSREFHAATEAWPPYAYQDKDNKPTGIDYFCVKRYLNHLGLILN